MLSLSFCDFIVLMLVPQTFAALYPNELNSATFPVYGGMTLEVCVARWWAALHDTTLEYTVAFHGLKPSTDQITMYTNNSIHRLDVAVTLRSEDLWPQATLKHYCQVTLHCLAIFFNIPTCHFTNYNFNLYNLQIWNMMIIQNNHQQFFFRYYLQKCMKIQVLCFFVCLMELCCQQIILFIQCWTILKNVGIFFYQNIYLK